MRLKNKKHKHFSRTDNKKYQEQNHKKEKTNNNNNNCYCHFLSHSRPLYSSHTTHHPTNNTQPHAAQNQWATTSKMLLHQRGDSIEQQSCCSRHPTACHKNKTNHQNQNTNTLAETPKKLEAPLCFTDPPTRA